MPSVSCHQASSAENTHPCASDLDPLGLPLYTEPQNCSTVALAPITNCAAGRSDEHADRDPLALAQALIDAGVPVVICRPNPRWRPADVVFAANGKTEPEMFWPMHWNTIAAAECDLSAFRPGSIR